MDLVKALFTTFITLVFALVAIVFLGIAALLGLGGLAVIGVMVIIVAGLIFFDILQEKTKQFRKFVTKLFNR